MKSLSIYYKWKKVKSHFKIFLNYLTVAGLKWCPYSNLSKVDNIVGSPET